MPASAWIDARLLALAALMATGGPAAAQDSTPVLEFQIAADAPCRDLPHVDILDRAEISAFDISMTGHQMHLRLRGHLRCRAAAGPIVPLHAAADFEATVRLRLSDCQPVSTEVTQSNLAAATVIAEAFQVRLDAVIGARAQHWAVETCAALSRP